MNQQSNKSAGGILATGKAIALHGKKPMTDAQINAVSKDFESMFIGEMMEPMFGDSVGTSLFGDEETAEVYKGLMVEQYSKKISDAGGIGIADYVKTELLKQQEVNP